MKNKLLHFFKNLSLIEWVTVFLLSGAVWMLIGGIIVLLTNVPEAGAVILLIGGGMVLLAIPFIFICSFRRALLRIAREKSQADPSPVPEPKPEPKPAPKPEPKPAPKHDPAPLSAPEATVATPAVKPQPKAAVKAGYVYLLDELEMQHRTTLTKNELKEMNGITLVLAREREGYALQMVRAVGGNVETKKTNLPDGYFQTHTRNEFRIYLFEQGIFRVDVDLLWEDPAFRAITALQGESNGT